VIETNARGSLKYRLFLSLRAAVRAVTDKVDLLTGPVHYNEDGLATSHNADFLKDRLFAESYALGKRTGSWGACDVHWRCYVCCWAAGHAASLDGDFVECGVNRGGFSRAVANYVDLPRSGKRMFLFDTFHGLDLRFVSATERENGIETRYTECYDDVVSTFSGLPVEIIRGAVPETLSRANIDRVAYLSIDMNCVEPEIAAMRHFWPKLVSGGVVVHDDYGFKGFELQKQALDAFAADVGVRVLQMPTGQGLLFKP
jgi:O-methyltransferase